MDIPIVMPRRDHEGAIYEFVVKYPPEEEGQLPIIRKFPIYRLAHMLAAIQCWHDKYDRTAIGRLRCKLIRHMVIAANGRL